MTILNYNHVPIAKRRKTWKLMHCYNYFLRVFKAQQVKYKTETSSTICFMFFVNRCMYYTITGRNSSVCLPKSKIFLQYKTNVSYLILRLQRLSKIRKLKHMLCLCIRPNYRGPQKQLTCSKPIIYRQFMPWSCFLD